MMKPVSLILLAVCGYLLSACDEGRLYESVTSTERDGGVAHVDVVTQGADRWPDGYQLVVAGFEPGNEYAVISKSVVLDDEGKCVTDLVAIPQEVTTVELCVIDRLRRRVASFASVAYEDHRDAVSITGLTVDVSPATAIQNEIFNTTCINCHGGSSHAAGQLNLTGGKSFGQLVNMVSVKDESLKRVTPGNHEESVLWVILSSNASASWKYDHSVEIVAQEKLNLIKDWIDNGAVY